MPPPRECLLLRHRLLTHAALLLCPVVRRLGVNQIKDTGASALAAVLKETQISDLKCAAAPRVFAFVSAPADKKANTLWRPTSLTSPAHPVRVLFIPLLCALVSQR